MYYVFTTQDQYSGYSKTKLNIPWTKVSEELHSFDDLEEAQIVAKAVGGIVFDNAEEFLRNEIEMGYKKEEYNAMSFERQLGHMLTTHCSFDGDWVK